MHTEAAVPLKHRAGHRPRPWKAGRRGAGASPAAARRSAHLALLLMVLPATLAAAATAAAATAAAAQLPAAVEVRVTRAGDAAPLAGVRVEAEGTGISGRTDGEGRAHLRGLPPGTHSVRASHLGHAPAVTSVEVATGRLVTLSMVLLPQPVALEALRVEAEGARLPPGAVLLRPGDAPPGTRTVADLVAGVTGVTVVRRGGPGSPATPSIRGSSADQVLVLVDGIPVNAPLTGEADLGALALGNVDRVVVIPGAVSARYGSGALGGVILVESGSATSRRGASSTSGALTAGSHGERGLRAAGALRPGPSSPLPAVDLRVQGDEARGDFRHPLPPFRGGGTARRINADHKALRAHLAVDPGPVRLQLHAQRLDRGTPGTVAQPSATGRQRQERVGASLSLRGTPHGEGEPTPPRLAGWEARLAGSSHRATHQDPSPPFGPAYHSDTRVREGALEAHGWQERRHQTGTLTLETGVSARMRAMEGSSLGPDAPGHLREGGLWVQGGWRWPGAGSAVEDSLLNPHPWSGSLTTTLRADAHDLVRGLTWSPALAGELRRGATRASVRWAQAFSPPSLADLFFQEGVLARANPELAPERVRGEWTVELSRELAAGPVEGQVNLAAWQGDVEGMILWFPDFRFVWSPGNVDVRRRGASASAEFRLPARRTGLRASVERNRVTYAGPVLDGPVVYRPSWKGTLHLHAGLRAADLHLGLEAHGTRRTVPGSELNALDPFATVEAGVSLPLPLPFRLPGGTGAHLELAGRNLTRAQAAFLADYPLPGRWWTLSVRVGDP